MELTSAAKLTEAGAIPTDWLALPLGTLTVLMTNGFVGVATRHYSSNENGVLYIQGYNVEENAFNMHGVKYVNQDFHRAHLKSSLRGNDLLTIQTGDVGLTTIVPERLAGSNCHALIISRFDQKLTSPAFIAHYLNSKPGRARLRLIETGTTMKHLNIADMLQFVVPLPASKAEQEAIANALSDADALIESLEQLITKKRHIKQGAMQELLTRKKRLPGFQDEWKRGLLGDLLTIMHGKSQKGVDDANGAYPILASGGIIGNASRFLYDKPSVLIGRKGTIDKPQYMDTPFWSVDTLFYSVVLSANNAKFLFYRFCLIDWKKHNEASGVPSLNAKTIERIEIAFPLGEEQTAIATILSDMDTELAELEQKLTKARQIKQGMMANLLTGKIRLV